MVCRGTTAIVVMLVMLSITQAAQSAEPSQILMQQQNVDTMQNQLPAELKIACPESSLEFVIRDPAIRSLINTSARPPVVRPVNLEAVDLTPEKKSTLVSQLGEDKPRDALDALRAVTDDLDLDPPPTTPDAASDANPLALPIAQPDVPADVKPAERSNFDVSPPNEVEVDPRSAVLDALRAEQRKRELQLLLDSANRSDLSAPPKDLDLKLDADQIEDKQADANVSRNHGSSDVEPQSPDSTEDRRSDYDSIPWTIAGLFDEPEDYDRQCREQEFCQRMWECAGGRSLSPCDRWKRNARRTHELMYGNYPSSHPMPLFSGIFIEPLLGYGLFGAPIGGVGGSGAGCGCHNCGHGCQASVHLDNVILEGQAYGPGCFPHCH
jgi:hypothetical protein